MNKFNFCLMIGLLGGLIITYKLAASAPGPNPQLYYHGLMAGLQGGMLNTLADEGKNPDTGTFGAHIAYFGAYKKTEQAKNYSYFRGGLDYESAWPTAKGTGKMAQSQSALGVDSSLQGLGLFADTGAVLFDIWRIGQRDAGPAINPRNPERGDET